MEFLFDGPRVLLWSANRKKVEAGASTAPEGLHAAKVANLRMMVRPVTISPHQAQELTPGVYGASDLEGAVVGAPVYVDGVWLAILFPPQPGTPGPGDVENP